jgi:abortive infection bacteriophage resistance protein
MNNVIQVKDWIKRLEKQGLIIEDKKLLAYYINFFNYHSIINGYGKPFMMETSYERYEHGATSNQIIALYKYERDLSNHLIKWILVIEKILNTTVTYNIINYHNIKDKCLLKLDHLYIKNNIFTNIHDVEPKTSSFMLLEKAIKYLEKNEMCKKYVLKNAHDDMYK